MRIHEHCILSDREFPAITGCWKMQDSSLPVTEPPKVMVVDDDPAVLGSLKFFLELEGFAVATCRSANELLQQTGFPRVGCLVIDYHLPGTNGLDLLLRLRERDVDLPAILITSNPTSYLRSRAVAAGASIVEKPLLGDALIKCISDALERSVGMPRL